MKYQVKDGIAVNSDTNEQYSCDAQDGVYDVDCFTEPELQAKDNMKRETEANWFTMEVKPRTQSDRYEWRYFLPFNPIPKMGSPITEPKIGEIWIDGLGNNVELLDIGYDQRFPRFLCKKLKNGSECYREFNELICKMETTELQSPEKGVKTKDAQLRDIGVLQLEKEVKKAEKPTKCILSAIDKMKEDGYVTGSEYVNGFIDGSKYGFEYAHLQPANNDYAVRVIELELSKQIASKSGLTFQGKMNTQLIIDTLNGILKLLLTPNN